MRKTLRRKKRPEVMKPTKILNETSDKSENVRTSWIIKTEISAGRFTMGQLLTAIPWNLTEDKNNLKFVYKILIFFSFFDQLNQNAAHHVDWYHLEAISLNSCIHQQSRSKNTCYKYKQFDNLVN